MEKKSFLLFLKNYSPALQISKKCDEILQKKKQLPAKNTLYEVQKFIHKGR
jgi:hypothetical protein